jgi:hypothetical protein
MMGKPSASADPQEASRDFSIGANTQPVGRRVPQILLWTLESRQHAAFRDDWRPWARQELRGLAAALDARP